tara:strand:+ start:494 stop:796 length:303 start_codon:yes stop_codon:yes gene_type:complete
LHVPDKLHFARGVLREKKMAEDGADVKAGFLSDSNKNKGWILSNFRTNGVVVTLTFATNDEALLCANHPSDLIKWRVTHSSRTKGATWPRRAQTRTSSRS